MERKITLPKTRIVPSDKDLGGLKALLEFLPGAITPAAAQLQLKRCMPNVLAVDDNTGPVAFTAFSYPYWGGVAMIDLLVVAPQYRRQRLASLLCQHIEQTAREARLNRICIQIVSGNNEALGFCMSQGFNMQSLFPSYFGSGINLVWLDKELQ